jgi:peptidoglycan/xylan/chitin deacetylase (PgdA/CDA1 family)
MLNKFFPNTIINFHAVYDKAWMEKVLILLKKNYNMVSAIDIESFYRRGYKLKNSCHITFDDGDQSFYKIVYPIIKKHKIPVSIYVSPLMTMEKKNFWFQEILGYDNKKLREIISTTIKDQPKNYSSYPLGALLKNMQLEFIWKIIYEYQKETSTPMKPGMNMTYEQLLELHRSGLVEIGAHTQNHPILKNENDKTAFIEITESISQLRIMLQSEVKYFAYPNGVPHLDFGQREINILKNAGIYISYSTENNTIDAKDDPLSVPRNGISKGNNAFIMAKLFAGRRWDPFKKLLIKGDEIKYRYNKCL